MGEPFKLHRISGRGAWEREGREGMSERVDFYRQDASRKLNPWTRSEMGQFMTPVPVARFMASLFKKTTKCVRLLDAGAGIGMLVSAFVERFCSDDMRPENINVAAYEPEPLLIDYLNSTLANCRQECENADIKFSGKTFQEDFIKSGVEIINDTLFPVSQNTHHFTHVIINPPYKKIRNDSEHRRRLRSVGIEAGNLYTAFLSLSVSLLETCGEIAAIVPRSFCNGPYFRSFRKLFLNQMTLTRIHLFDTRNETFKDDDVLQENIIFHAVKGMKPGFVLISASSGSDFGAMTLRKVSYEKVLRPDDSDLIIHVAPSEMDQHVIDRMAVFKDRLKDIGVEVSTGPVVDFRLRKHLRENPRAGSVPLIYPTHFYKHFIVWPKKRGENRMPF